jgi:hypothetical protein
MSSISSVESLVSNHEEADIKMILHCLYALKEKDTTVILRSPSADTDIMILAVNLLQEENHRIFIDFGTGNNRKGMWLNDVNHSPEKKNSLIGLHAFTGNDYTSSFFRRGKVKCWGVMKSQEKFVYAFERLGNEWQLSSELFALLEEFVCHLYGYHQKSINIVRHQMFMKKYASDNKCIDMSVLPPCRSVLHLHADRCNFVANMWKQSIIPKIDIPPIDSCGWYQDGSIQWIDKAFPDEITDILLDPEYDTDDEYGSDVETDDDMN